MASVDPEVLWITGGSGKQSVNTEDIRVAGYLISELAENFCALQPQLLAASDFLTESFSSYRLNPDFYHWFPTGTAANVQYLLADAMREVGNLVKELWQLAKEAQKAAENYDVAEGKAKWLIRGQLMSEKTRGFNKFASEVVKKAAEFSTGISFDSKERFGSLRNAINAGYRPELKLEENRLMIPVGSPADFLARMNDPGFERNEESVLLMQGDQTVDGRKVYYLGLPGTKSWDLSDKNQMNAKSIIELLQSGDSNYLELVEEALRVEGVPAGSELHILGHSQGGMVAMALATDEEFNKSYRVSTVITAGSPVGLFPRVSGDSQALHLENINDFVPAISGATGLLARQNTTIVKVKSETGSPHAATGYAKSLRNLQRVNNASSQVVIDRFNSSLPANSGQVQARFYSVSESSETKPQYYSRKRKEAIQKAVG